MNNNTQEEKKPKVKKVKLTASEAEILWSAAGQMADDFDYYKSLYPPAKYKRMQEAFNTGMVKLRSMFK